VVQVGKCEASLLLSIFSFFGRGRFNRILTLLGENSLVARLFIRRLTAWLSLFFFFFLFIFLTVLNLSLPLPVKLDEIVVFELGADT